MRSCYEIALFALMYQAANKAIFKPISEKYREEPKIGGGWGNRTKCQMYFIKRIKARRKKNRVAKRSRQINRKK